MSDCRKSTRQRSLSRFLQRVYHKARESQWLRWVFPIAGLLAALWFLIRVVPKPARATYPCQRVALPLAGGFFAWLMGGLVAVVLARKTRALLRGVRGVRVVGWLSLAGLAALLTIVYLPPRFGTADSGLPSNDPIGVGRGIHPGRVVWVHDPESTDWEGTNDYGEDIGDGLLVGRRAHRSASCGGHV